jgi:two-component system sensor histidine kinase DesK
MIDFVYRAEVPELPPRVDNELALILREAVTNIHRHAGASFAEVTVSMDDRACMMTIVDNGRGFAGSEGNGICGMRERARALGGTLAFESVPQKGTVVRIQVPLVSADRFPSAGARRDDALPYDHDRLAS